MAGTHHWTELWKVIVRRNILAAKAFDGLLVKFEALLDFFETEQKIDPDLLVANPLHFQFKEKNNIYLVNVRYG